MINTTILQGRLTSDPELKSTTAGTPCTRFGIAVERRYQKSGEDKQTDFINIVAWKHLAEFICRYFSKGDMIVLRGHIQTDSYKDKQGNKRTFFEVVVEELNPCGPKSNKTEFDADSDFEEIPVDYE